MFYENSNKKWYYCKVEATMNGRPCRLTELLSVDVVLCDTTNFGIHTKHTWASSTGHWGTTNAPVGGGLRHWQGVRPNTWRILKCSKGSLRLDLTHRHTWHRRPSARQRLALAGTARGPRCPEELTRLVVRCSEGPLAELWVCSASS